MAKGDKTKIIEWEDKMEELGLLKKTKSQYLKVLDIWAKNNATNLAANIEVTNDLLAQLTAIYAATHVEKDDFNVENHFELAYQPPVTADFEFLIARTVHHFGQNLSLHWKVFLRRQFKGLAPDILIKNGDHTIGIVEIKSSLGWIRHLFWSQEKIKEMRMRPEKPYDAEVDIQKFKGKLEKYIKTFRMQKEYFYFLVPTLCDVKSTIKVDNYRQIFTRNSGLPQENLVLFSEDLCYHPAGKKNKPSHVTQDFNRMIEKLKLRCSRL